MLRTSIFRRALFFPAVFALLLACPPRGHALELVRPSRGPPVTVLSAVTVTTTSSAYEWSAFTGATVRLASAGACTGTIALQECATVNGAFFNSSDPIGVANVTLPDPSSGATEGAVYVPAAAPFIRFVFTATACPGALTVTAIPESFTLTVGVQGTVPAGAYIGRSGPTRPVIIGGLLPGAVTDTGQTVGVTANGQMLVETGAHGIAATTDTVIAVTNAAGGSLVVAAAAATVGVHSTTVQNLSATAITCSLGGVPVIGTTGIILAAGTGANTGDGGSSTWNGYTGAITCIAAGAGGSVAVQRW